MTAATKASNSAAQAQALLEGSQKSLGGFMAAREACKHADEFTSMKTLLDRQLQMEYYKSKLFSFQS
jgi:hypothetical protein